MIKSPRFRFVSLVLVCSIALSYGQGFFAQQEQSTASSGQRRQLFSASTAAVALCPAQTYRQRQSPRQMERKGERSGKSNAPFSSIVAVHADSAQSVLPAVSITFCAGSFAAHNKYKNLTAFLQTLV